MVRQRLALTAILLSLGKSAYEVLGLPGYLLDSQEPGCSGSFQGPCSSGTERSEILRTRLPDLDRKCWPPVCSQTILKESQ